MEKEIALFGMLDGEIAKYLGIPVRTYIEKTENLSDEDLLVLEGLLVEWLDEGNPREEILELLTPENA
jgi:hypothetical protein